jgi:hypothetical protein
MHHAGNLGPPVGLKALVWKAVDGQAFEEHRLVGNEGYLGDVGLEHIPVGESLPTKSLKKHIFSHAARSISHAVRSTGIGF